MTPIQTHEAELRAMMERAGLKPKERNAYYLDGTSDHAKVTLTTATSGTMAYTPDGPVSAEHPDPRIALRACLEMAGLLTDRPPQTDAELVAWLTERSWRTRYGTVTYHHDPDMIALAWFTPFVHGSLPARIAGQLLWCAERFPEVKP